MAVRTRRPRKSPDQVAAEVAALVDKLNAGVAELTTSDQWTAMLRVAAHFWSYSFRNMMLLHLQAEERETTITRVGGVRTWNALGRRVRKGESGYQILAPMWRRLSEDEAAAIGPAAYDAQGRPQKVIRGYKIEYVFDVAQTEGDELPVSLAPDTLTGGDPAGLFDRLGELVTAEGYRIERHPEAGTSQGWTNYAERTVSVRPDVDPAQAAYVLAHELGHIRARHDEREISRPQRETEADSIAYVVCTALGLDSDISSVPYVAGWSDGDPEVIAAAADIVRREASRILSELQPADDDQTPQASADDAA